VTDTFGGCVTRFNVNDWWQFDYKIGLQQEYISQ
jgi:hypothetical protein